jgi:hypothetical protein
MTPILEEAALESDLDCQNLDLQNIGHFYPVPDGLVDKNDPTLYDPRVPPFASVTNDSVSPAAEISQSKLNLNDVIPPEWLTDGTAIISGQKVAAKGSSAEFRSRKGAPNGYAALDAAGKIPLSNVAAGAGLGTVTSVAFLLPPELTATPPITDSGVFSPQWNDVPDGSWFGVHGVGLDGVLKPSFKVERMPPGIMPPLDASKFTSGVFPPEFLPVAIGIGTGNAPGAVPDPGEMGEPTDYLGRDMQWHQFQVDVEYQPTCPKPVITLDTWSKTEVLVTVRSPLRDSAMFISINGNPYKQGQVKYHGVVTDDVHDTISVKDFDIITAYAAKAGYNNSDIAIWQVITPLTQIP